MKRIVSTIICCVVALFSHSQEIELNLKDSISNDALPFVTVYLKNNGVGATTDLYGNMTLSVPNTGSVTDTLICSYYGYEKKYIPVDVTESFRLDILLAPSIQNIDVITVTAAKKQLTAKQIVKKVLKNTPDNYATQPANLLGLYRETFWEDNRAAHLSEAAINIHYNKYPQGKFQRRNWKDWFYDDTYAFELNYSQFDGFPNQFNSDGDRVEILAARSTKNWSKYGFRGSIIGGPLSITSKDYVKYQSDFLDPGNLKKYAYEKRGLENIDGKTCYVIHFYPLEMNRKMSIFFGRKIKRSIFVGEMYVDRESFAVVRMRFQLAQNVDFGFYQQFVPLDHRVEVDYKKHDDFWALDRIKLTQIRSYKMMTAGRKVLYQSDQELFFTEVVTDSVKQIPLDREWKHTRITTLRDHEVAYVPDYWRKMDTTTFPSISTKVVHDLTKEIPLEEQFQQRFKQQEDMPEPQAEKIAFEHTYSRETLQDPYHWFSDGNRSQEFYQYLDEENKYADNYSIALRNYEKKFFRAIRNFFPKDTTQVTQLYQKGQIVWDEDSLGNTVYFEYLDTTNRTAIFNLTQFQSERPRSYIEKIKFSKNKIGIQYTTNGSLNNHLIVLNKGALEVQDSLSDIYSYEWLNDSILFYTPKNTLKRSDKLFERNVALRQSEFILEELDLTYDVSVSQSKSFMYTIIESKDETEIYSLNKKSPENGFEMLFPRKKGVFNEIVEFNGVMYLLTNHESQNNKILREEAGEWIEVVPDSKKRLINSFVVTENFTVLNTFENGYCKLQYRRNGEKKWEQIELPIAIVNADIYTAKNDKIKIQYSAPNTPWSLATFDLNSEQLTITDQSKIKRQYTYELRSVETTRVYAKAKDGTKIPITISKSSNPRRKHKGLILKVYGAYGAYPRGHSFSAEDLILMKDGFTVAYAHVRGGRIMGRRWYEEGKLMNKENSFGDYIACSEYLIDKEYTDKDHLIGYGQSAGGTVVGVAINRRPELFNTVILDHPYLDVLTTMMNDTLPLTTDHYKEVGNPNEEAYYDLLKNYSPYQNIKKQDYPNMLFIAGSNDYQTQAWQIAKCAAKLREMNTAETTLLFKTDIGSGHMGSTQGDQWMRDLAFKNAFIYGNLFD